MINVIKSAVDELFENFEEFGFRYFSISVLVDRLDKLANLLVRDLFVPAQTFEGVIYESEYFVVF